MRILLALPGLHRYDRGAEVAFISIANELSKLGNEVTLIGSGRHRPLVPYRYIKVACIDRRHFESFPTFPPLRSDSGYEELTFLPGFISAYRPAHYDVTLTCSYPFVNWALRRATLGGHRPPHVFVTQNGDWPAYARNSEYRLFGCEGLVCTNPDFYERNHERWFSRLIPNGVNVDIFRPGASDRAMFNLPSDRTVVLMVSALIGSKYVEEGVEAVSRVANSHLVIAGDGPLRDAVVARAEKVLPNRYTHLLVPPEKMPSLYRSADVFLHMSKDESFGNVYLESLACGLPIVGHDTPRLRWILGKEGFLTDTNDLDSVATHITSALQASHTGHSQRAERASGFSWSRIGQMYQEFLEKVIRRYT